MEIGQIVAQGKTVVVLSKTVEIMDLTLVLNEPVLLLYYLRNR